ncbi:hypothetical protein TNCV_1086551 [Trichonephila clavipes]|nr:hypothetical protein TNCV_1086551 [Trichonephila clavipes]
MSLFRGSTVFLVVSHSKFWLSNSDGSTHEMPRDPEDLYSSQAAAFLDWNSFERDSTSKSVQRKIVSIGSLESSAANDSFWKAQLQQPSKWQKCATKDCLYRIVGK